MKSSSIHVIINLHRGDCYDRDHLGLEYFAKEVKSAAKIGRDPLYVDYCTQSPIPGIVEGKQLTRREFKSEYSRYRTYRRQVGKTNPLVISELYN